MNEVWCVIPRSWTDWLMGFVQLWFVKNYVRHHLMIMHALSLFRDTPHLPSRWLLCAKQTCWYKQVDFQLLNTHPFKVFLVETSDFVRIHSSLYQLIPECTESWAHIIQTVGNHPQEVIQHSSCLSVCLCLPLVWKNILILGRNPRNLILLYFSKIHWENSISL